MGLWGNWNRGRLLVEGLVVTRWRAAAAPCQSPNGHTARQRPGAPATPRVASAAAVSAAAGGAACQCDVAERPRFTVPGDVGARYWS
jgi:hypothetical protein